MTEGNGDNGSQHPPAEPEVPGYSIETGLRAIVDAGPCYLVMIHLISSGPFAGQIFITPWRRTAYPVPKPHHDPVTICWRLGHPDLDWGAAGVTMKAGWDPGWGIPTQTGPNTYELVVQNGPVKNVLYDYGLDLEISGNPIPTIDPEIEYDD